MRTNSLSYTQSLPFVLHEGYRVLCLHYTHRTESEVHRLIPVRTLKKGVLISYGEGVCMEQRE